MGNNMNEAETVRLLVTHESNVVGRFSQLLLQMGVEPKTIGVALIDLRKQAPGIRDMTRAVFQSGDGREIFYDLTEYKDEGEEVAKEVAVTIKRNVTWVFGEDVIATFSQDDLVSFLESKLELILEHHDAMDGGRWFIEQFIESLVSD